MEIDTRIPALVNKGPDLNKLKAEERIEERIQKAKRIDDSKSFSVSKNIDNIEKARVDTANLQKEPQLYDEAALKELAKVNAFLEAQAIEEAAQETALLQQQYLEDPLTEEDISLLSSISVGLAPSPGSQSQVTNRDTVTEILGNTVTAET